MKHKLDKNVLKFLNSFDSVKLSSNKNDVIDLILDTKNSITNALGQDIESISWFAPRGHSQKGFALSEMSKLNDSYWESVRDFHLNNGNPIQLSDEFKISWYEQKLKERNESYEIWLKYIISDDASYIPNYMHSWILKGVSKIGRYNFELSKFVRRKPNTMDSFTILYPDLLASCVKKLKLKIRIMNLMMRL